MSYGTVAEADIYHTTAGSAAAWSAFPSSEREQAIFRATWYIDGVYADRFYGAPTGTAEEWPRKGAVDSYGTAIAEDSIPQQITAATFVAALHDLQNPNTLWKTLDPAKHISRSEVGPLKKSFFEHDLDDPVILQSVEAILRRILKKPIKGNQMQFGVV